MADSIQKIEIRQNDGIDFNVLLYPKTTAEEVVYDNSTVQEQLTTNISNITSNINGIMELNSELITKPSESGIIIYEGDGTNTSTITSISTSTGIVSGADGIVNGNAVYENNAQITTQVINSPSILSSTTAQKFIDNKISTSSPTNPNDAFNALVDNTTIILDDVYTESFETNGKVTVDIEPLSVSRPSLAATTIGDYALFAGGGVANGYYVNTVDIYNSNLTRSQANPLRLARLGLGGTTVGNYALFAGGRPDGWDADTYSKVVDSYNKSLTRGSPTSLSTSVRTPGATHNNAYAFFFGGSYYTTDGSKQTSTVNVYNSSLTKSNATAVSFSSAGPRGTWVGNYALLVGAQAVNAYDESLTRSVITSLSVSRTSSAGANVVNYGIFAGGQSTTNVDAYNTSLTRSTPAALTHECSGASGISSSNYAYVGGGTTSYADSVDAYNISLTKSILPALNAAKQSQEGTFIDKFAIFAGGTVSSDSVNQNTIDVYSSQLMYYLSLPLPATSQYYFDNVTSSEVFSGVDTSVQFFSTSKFNGYIKRGFTITGKS